MGDDTPARRSPSPKRHCGNKRSTPAGAMGDDTPASSGSCICIDGLKDFKDEFRMFKKPDEIRPVLAKIKRIHDKDRDIAASVSDNGFCFGLLDPATNVLVNRVLSISNPEAAPAPPPPPQPRADGGQRWQQLPRRRRRGQMEDEDDDDERSRAVADMARRSYDGLIAFLTCLFPYLPDGEAMVYLDAAGLDPLVAALLIISRRGMRDFDLNSHTTQAATEVALRCAATAAKHPDPRWVVLAWKLLSPAVESLVSSGSKLELDSAVLGALKINVVAASDDPVPVLQLKGPWELAKKRFAAASSRMYHRREQLPSARAAVKRMLLATIHGYYLRALGRLPTAELCSRYHRSLLLGGYCYGPLDPVSNIIVNTIWYEQNLPTSKQFSVAMVSTQMLWRIAAQSMYGLMSFLCTRYPGLTPDEAAQRLLVTGANLQAADLNLSATLSDSHSPAAEESTWPVTTVAEAYTAAATAALHSFPLAHQEFLASSGSVFGSASELLHARDGGPLSSQDISLLCMILQACPSSSAAKSQEQQEALLAPTKVKKLVYSHTCQYSRKFWRRHERVTSMVRDALEKFNRTAAEDRQLELHIICGVNEFVSGPERTMDGIVRDYNPWTPDKYCHSHINFLAVCKGRPYDPPTIFFAECGKDGADTCWCVPVIPQKPEAEQPRCVYCEHQANRIVHPTVESFCGHDEFDMLFYLSDRKFYSNDRIIQHSSLDVAWVHGVEDSAIYLNYCPDENGDSDDEADWIQIS